MKKLLTFSLLICLLFSFHFSAKASHMVGAEISYTCTSTPGTWQVTLTLYRDCQGIPICSGGCGAPCTRTININGADPSCNGTSFGSFMVSLVSVSDVNVNPQCPSAKSICNSMGCVTPGAYIPGVEKYVFQGDVNLGTGSGIPPSCCNVRLSWQECCRNGAITTIVPNNFYIEAVMNRCLSLSPCNSSPQFSNDPFTVICGGQPFIFNNGATDPDHDSLSYSFSPALEGPASSASYRSPYSAQTPMPWVGPASAPFPQGIRCDSVGNIMFTPAYGAGGQFVGVVVVTIKQWKKISGVPTLMGTTTRDNQMWLISCPPNNYPTFSTTPAMQTINGVPSLTFYAYRGIPLCFDVIAKDTDFSPFSTPPLSDSTYLSWNNSLAAMGATFTSNYVDSLRKILGPREDTKRFCWTPQANAVSTIPYYFTISAKDSRCPNPGKIILAVSILVSNFPVINVLKTPLGCNWNMSFSSNVPLNTITYEWQVSNTKGNFNPTNYSSYHTQSISNFNYTDTGKYVVRLLINSGTQNAMTYYDTINHTKYTTLSGTSVNDTGICANGFLKLKTTVNGGNKPYLYNWYNLNSGSILSTSDTLLLSNISVNTNYKLTVRDSIGCMLINTFLVTANPIPVLTRPQPLQACKSIKIINLDTFQLNPSGGTGIWSYPSRPEAIISGSISQVRLDSLKNLPLDSVNYTSGFDNWIQYKYTSPAGCTNYDSAKVTVFGNPYVDAGFAVRLCKNAGTFKLQYDATRLAPYNTWLATPVDTTGQIGVWSGTGVNAVTYGTKILYSFDPLKIGVLMSPAKNTLTYKYTKQYTGTGAPSCQGQDNVQFEVNPIPIIDAGNMPPICSTEALFKLSAKSGANVSNGATGFWTYANVIPKYGIDLAMKDSQNFDASKISFPVTTPPTTQYSWKIYFNDMSTACAAAKDSLTLTAVKSPSVDLMFSSPSDSLLCLKTGKKTLSISVSPTGGFGTFTSSPATPAFTQDQFDPSKGILNTDHTALSAGIYKLIYTYSVQILTALCKNTDTATVNVNAIPVTTITGPSNVNPAISYPFTANTTAGSVYNWGLTNGSIISGQGTSIVNVSFITKGISQLKVIETTTSGCRDTVTKTISVNTTGVNDISIFKNLNIYPNPANTELNIELGDVNEETIIEMIDVLGKTIMQKSIHAKHHFIEKLDVSELARGVYFISIKVGEQQTQSKVVLK